MVSPHSPEDVCSVNARNPFTNPNIDSHECTVSSVQPAAASPISGYTTLALRTDQHEAPQITEEL